MIIADRVLNRNQNSEGDSTYTRALDVSFPRVLKRGEYLLGRRQAGTVLAEEGNLGALGSGLLWVRKSFANQN
jgi:hypothetical protein